jgi:hypothetical protein
VPDDDARAALRAVADPIAETLGDGYVSATIDLDPVMPLPDSFPPRMSLAQLAELLTGDEVAGVRQIKPVRDWPCALRKSLSRLGRPELSVSDPHRLHPEARAIADVVERQLGTIRIAATIQFGGGGYRGCVDVCFLLVTPTHLALLRLTLDD